MQDDLEHAQKSPPAENLAVTASSSSTADLSQALNWDNSFKDPSLEQKYANSWWFETCLILHHIRLVAAIQATIILAYIFLVHEGRSFLVTQTTALIQQLLCFCVVSLRGGEIQRTAHGQNTLLAAVFLPLMSAWLLSWIFQRGFAGGGWCHLGSSVDMEIFCLGVQNKKLPQELLCYTFLTTAALIVYTKVSMVLLACYLGAFCAIIVTTVGQAAGSGCILFLGSSVFWVIIAQSQEVSVRHRFIVGEQLISHARAIAQYGEGISTHVLSQPCFGLGSGNGGEQKSQRKRKAEINNHFIHDSITMPDTQVVHLGSSTWDDFAVAMAVASGSVTDPVDGAAVKRCKEECQEANRTKQLCSETGKGPSKRPRGPFTGDLGNWYDIGTTLMDASPDAIVIVNRSTLHFEVQNSIFVQMIHSEDPDTFHHFLKAHFRQLFASNPGAFKVSYPTTIGSTQLNVCASCTENSVLVVVTIQDISTMMRQQQTLRMGLGHMVELAQSLCVQTPGQGLAGNLFRPTSHQSFAGMSTKESQASTPQTKFDGTSDTAASAESGSKGISDDMGMSSDLDTLDFTCFIDDIQQLQDFEVDTDSETQPQVTSVVKKEKKKKIKRPTQPPANNNETENKVKVVRKPYRFCVSCWIMKGEWAIKALTMPDGRNVQVGGHTQMR